MTSHASNVPSIPHSKYSTICIHKWLCKLTNLEVGVWIVKGYYASWSFDNGPLARNKVFLWGRVRSVKKWLKVHTHLQVATFPSHKAKDPHEGRTTKKKKRKKNPNDPFRVYTRICRPFLVFPNWFAKDPLEIEWNQIASACFFFKNDE